MLHQEQKTKKVHLRGIDEKFEIASKLQPETDGSESPVGGLVRGRTNLVPAIPSPRKNLQVQILKGEGTIHIWQPKQNGNTICGRNARKIAYRFKPWGVKPTLATSPFASTPCSPLCFFKLEA